MTRKCSVRRAGFVLVAASVGLLAGCGGDQGPGAGAAAGDPSTAPSEAPHPPPETGSWTARPGQLDKVTDALIRRRYSCTDMAGEEFTFRVCSGRLQRRYGGTGKPYLESQVVKLVAAQDGAVVRVALTGGDELLPQVGPDVFGAADTAVLEAQGTTIQWGTVAPEKLDGYQDSLVGTIKGLQRAPQPPSGRLPVTKEQLLLGLTKVPSWDCEIDDGMATAEPEDMSEVDVGPTLNCSDKTLPGDRQAVRVEFADGGGGIDDIELSAGHPARPPAPGALLGSRLGPVWSGLGDDADGIRAAVQRGLRSGIDSIAYADGWKVVVSTGDVREYDDPSQVSAYTVGVRVLRERPDLRDPKAAD